MVAAVGLLLTGCIGSTVEQRAATGALTGVGIGALAGGPVGAAIGFGAGVVAGAAAPVGADQVALWGVDHTERWVAGNQTMREMSSEGTSHPPRTASAATSAGGAGTPMMTIAAPPAGTDWAPTPQAVRDAQQSLRAQGLYNGPTDGILGPKTKAAPTQYQQRNNLEQTARLDVDTLNRLRNDTSNTAATRNQPGTAGQSGNPNAMPANQGAAGDQPPR